MAITVTSAAESKLLTTVTNFKELIGKSDTVDDTLLAKIISRASNAVVGYCGREFAKQTYTETLKGDGTPFLRLSRIPIVSITSVSYQGVAVSASDYVVNEPEQGVVTNLNSYWQYTGYKYEYSVVYVAGYVLPSFATGTVDLPPDIEQAVLEVAKIMWFSRKDDLSVTQETVPEVYSVSYGGRYSVGRLMMENPMIKDLLGGYILFKL